MKKLLLGLGAATSVIAPIAAVVACSGDKDDKGGEGNTNTTGITNGVTAGDTTKFYDLLLKSGATLDLKSDATLLISALGTSKVKGSFKALDGKSTVIFFENATPKPRVAAAVGISTTWDLALDRDTDSYKKTYGSSVVSFLRTNKNVTLALEVVVGVATDHPSSEKNNKVRLFELYSGTDKQVLAGSAKHSNSIDSSNPFANLQLTISDTTFSNEDTTSTKKTEDNTYLTKAVNTALFEELKTLKTVFMGKPINGVVRYYLSGTLTLGTLVGHKFSRTQIGEDDASMKTVRGMKNVPTSGFYIDMDQSQNKIAISKYDANNSTYLFTLNVPKINSK